ncbi:MAG TPA: ABC transporter ATP-binding protein, partial [Actinomycetota bacterium]|nr:ABC transporter ATP-binding protein [Actinomycetota bacterium]
VLTTHDMDEAASLADRVGIMDHGKLLALDTPAALTRGLPGRTTLEVAVTLDGTSAGELVAELGALDGVERVEQVGAAAGPPGGQAPGAQGGPRRELRARLYLVGEAPLLVAPVAALVARHRAQLTDVAIGTPSLEDVFIALTGRALR